MITFILNTRLITTENPPGTPLLDFIRTEMHLSGTKAGCREGDCGACTVMAGELVNNRMVYKTLVSCLTPLANVQGKHIVTIEGLQLDQDTLSPVQEAIVDHSATQCGFCTPGFVVSLTAHGLGDEVGETDAILQAISGNICRCTGYKSIERAAQDIASLYAVQGEGPGSGLDWMVAQGFLPDWFTAIPQRLAAIPDAPPPVDTGLILAGGTDLLVQQPDTVLLEDELCLFGRRTDLQTIEVAEGCCTLGAAVTTAEIMDSAIIRNAFPAIRNHFKLISSPSIRNVATLAGNIINGSPIADLSIFFLALDAEVLLTDTAGMVRQLPLREFFIGYKKQQIRAGEILQAIRFQLPANPDTDKFNFEKVSKRQHLDIASVNSAIGLTVDDTVLTRVYLSAGGVAPIPLYLGKTSSFLTGRAVNRQTVVQANAIMQEEIAPMSDIRGSKSYKRLLLRQLLFAHFLTLFPEIFSPEMLLQGRTT